MRKIILSIAAFVLASVALAAAAGAEDKADGPKSGDPMAAHAFCQGRGAAEALAEQMKQNGPAGYAAVMADPQVRCVDSRMHDIQAVNITLKERGWTTEAQGGKVFEFWLATDPRGQLGWVWVEVAGRRS